MYLTMYNIYSLAFTTQNYTFKFVNVWKSCHFSMQYLKYFRNNYPQNILHLFSKVLSSQAHCNSTQIIKSHGMG